jgi:hypothetical protein
MEDIKKNITLTGTTTRYHMKKLLKDKNSNEIKKRVASNDWYFSNKDYEHNNQLIVVNDIFNNKYHYTDTKISKIAVQQIQKKISGYKQQDILKKRYDELNFLTFDSIIQKMIECELKCRYCKIEIYVLYDISREMKQWSVDRIDNNLGHNINNYHLTCLECNLNKKTRNDEKYLFTKQLTIVKDGCVNPN